MLLENLKESKYFKSYSFLSSLLQTSQSKMNPSVYSLDKLIANYVHFFNELNVFIEKQKIDSKNLVIKIGQFIKKHNGNLLKLFKFSFNYYTMAVYFTE